MGAPGGMPNMNMPNIGGLPQHQQPMVNDPYGASGPGGYGMNQRSMGYNQSSPGQHAGGFMQMQHGANPNALGLNNQYGGPPSSQPMQMQSNPYMQG